MSIFELIQLGGDGLIPAVIVDADDGEVLTLCYMNREALELTLGTGKVHVFRRSKGRVMLKGETSGHVQHVKEILVDCEGKSLVIRVDQETAACHMGYKSCYFRRYDAGTGELVVTQERVFDPDQVYE